MAGTCRMPVLLWSLITHLRVWRQKQEDLGTQSGSLYSKDLDSSTGYYHWSILWLWVNLSALFCNLRTIKPISQSYFVEWLSWGVSFSIPQGLKSHWHSTRVGKLKNTLSGSGTPGFRYLHGCLSHFPYMLYRIWLGESPLCSWEVAIFLFQKIKIQPGGPAYISSRQ